MPLTLPNGKVLTDGDVLKTLRQYQHDCPAVLDLFDGTIDKPHDELLPIDLLSLNALNAFGPGSPMGAMTAAWARRAEIKEKVASITKTNFETLTPNEVEAQVPLLEVAVNAIDNTIGFGDTSSSKLLYRLRSNIAPIWDTRVAKWYPTFARTKTWAPWLKYVYSVSLDARNRDCLDSARQGVGRDLPLQRVWDIVLWQSSAPTNTKAR